MRQLWILLAALSFQAQAFNPKDFPSDTLKDFEAKRPHDGPGNTFSLPIMPVAIEVTTSLKFRPLSPGTRGFLEMYESTMGHTMQVKALQHYDSEIEVKEVGSNRVVWIPAQKTLVPALKEELKPGGRMKVFLRYFGAREGIPVYLMVEFQTVKKP